MVVVKFGVEFQVLVERMPGDEAEDLLLRTVPRKVIARLEIDVDRAHLGTRLNRHEQTWSRCANTSVLGPQGGARFDLREGRQLPARLALIEEAPFDTRKGVAPAAFARLAVGALHEIGNLVCELYAFAQSVIEIDLRHL